MNLTEEILRLKREKDALILAHYYESLELQLLADIVGDSLELSRKAKLAENRLVVFCGVRFMAESAKILNPAKKVVLPVADAGCPMADTITPEDILELRKKYPDATVVCYVNSTAETKAVSDICCTSSNAVKLVRSLDAKRVIFVPDRNLGAYVKANVPEKEVITFDGGCPIHNSVTEAEVLAAKAAHPNALVASHPECPKAVLDHSDYVGSTAQILDFVAASDAEEFIIGTEVGVVDRLNHFAPGKKYHLLTDRLTCADMKKTTLADLYRALAEETHEIHMTDSEIEAAKLPLERMLAIK